MCQLYCCLTSPCLYGRLALNSLHQGIFQLPGQHLEVPSVTSGGSRRRECLKPAKKQSLRRPERCAAPVQPCLSPSGLPRPEGKAKRLSRLSSIRHRHLAGRVPRAKRLGRRRRNPGLRNLHTALFRLKNKKTGRLQQRPAPENL